VLGKLTKVTLEGAMGDAVFDPYCCAAYIAFNSRSITVDVGAKCCCCEIVQDYGSFLGVQYCGGEGG